MIEPNVILHLHPFCPMAENVADTGAVLSLTLEDWQEDRDNAESRWKQLKLKATRIDPMEYKNQTEVLLVTCRGDTNACGGGVYRTTEEKDTRVATPPVD